MTNSDNDDDQRMPIYIGTVCLEKNRWSSKTPSFRVSEWIDRFKADGFDGIELWENHYTAADITEQQKLAQASLPINIFNSYAGFSDDKAEERKVAADAIAFLKSPALKYNLGYDHNKLAEYRRNLLAWSDALPQDCRLLCECHGGTVLETAEAAAEFHADLDPERFAIMIHPTADLDAVKLWFDSFGNRIEQMHLQLRPEETDPTTEAGRKNLKDCLSVIRDYTYRGGLTIEFTRGIGRDENIEDLYANACIDLKVCREIIS